MSDVISVVSTTCNVVRPARNDASLQKWEIYDIKSDTVHVQISYHVPSKTELSIWVNYSFSASKPRVNEILYKMPCIVLFKFTHLA